MYYMLFKTERPDILASQLEGSSGQRAISTEAAGDWQLYSVSAKHARGCSQSPCDFRFELIDSYSTSA